MSRSGHHVTGVSRLSSVLGAKRVQLLLELAPPTSHIALLMNPDNPNADA
jgi:putative ABC transport system substrate-binding protein